MKAKVINFKMNSDEEKEFKPLFQKVGKNKKYPDRSKAIKAAIRLMIRQQE